MNRNGAARGREWAGFLIGIRPRRGKRPGAEYLYGLPRQNRQQELVFGLGNAVADLLTKETGVFRGKIDWREKNRRITEHHIAHPLGITEFFSFILVGTRRSLGIRFVSQAELLSTAPASTEKDIEYNREHYGKGPLYMRVSVISAGRPVSVGIDPDALFALEYEEYDGRRLHFFYEHDRGSEVVIPRDAREGGPVNFNRSTIYKKLVGYHDVWLGDYH